MTKLHTKEREFLANAIEKTCKGTPLQPNAEFAGQYLGPLIASYIENWEPVRQGLGLPPTTREKVVYNTCFGGFNLSQKAFELYHTLKDEPLPTDPQGNEAARFRWVDKLERDDPYLVRVVETLGEMANGLNAFLCVEEVTPGLWMIHNFDGKERVEEAIFE